MSEDTKLILGKLEEVISSVNKLEGRMDRLEKRMDALEGRMNALEKRMDTLEKRMDHLEERMDRLEKRMDRLEERMDALEVRVDRLEERMDKVEQESRETRLQIENNIITNIQLLAESHLDLHKKVDAAMEAKTERELHLMRTAILEDDMRRVKEKVGIA